MIVTVNNIDMGLFGSSLLERSPGLHLSTVIRDLQQTLQTAKTANWKEAPTWNMGFLWELLLEREWAATNANIIRVGEVVKDGIIMTPDGIDVDRWVLEEYKVTWRSNRTKPWDVWEWMVQVKAYCLALQTNVARMRVLYVNGDWKGSGPDYIDCDIAFHDTELLENWQMILNHTKGMEDRI